MSGVVGVITGVFFKLLLFRKSCNCYCCISACVSVLFPCRGVVFSSWVVVDLHFCVVVVLQ